MTRDEYLSSGHWQSHKRGNDLPHARLNDELVREIRRNRHGLTARQWAVRLGLHYRTIEKVRHRETWNHVS